MLLRINEKKISTEAIDFAVKLLQNNGIIIYPTDTVYALGCDITKARAIERICRLKNVSPEKSNFSFVCSDLGHLAAFTSPIPNHIFRVMKRALPGPYTFILEANSQVPKLIKQNRKTVGIRVPDNDICRELVRRLGNPLMSTSLHDTSDDILDYFSDPEIIHNQYGDKVDLVIDGGFGNIYPSTVLDGSNGELVVVREGLGEIGELLG